MYMYIYIYIYICDVMSAPRREPVLRTQRPTTLRKAQSRTVPLKARSPEE